MNTLSLEINGRTLSVELNKVATQADGSALVRYGDTVMLVTATSKKEMKEEKEFLPLIVDYRENTYAAGKIPGGFFKREGRPSEREILTARLIDRPVRSLFPEGYHFDTQIVGLLLSADLENAPETLGLIGASCALYFSDIPFSCPMGAVKIGLVDDRFVINPPASELERSPLHMIVVSKEDGIVMIEAGAREVEEEKILEALALAHEANCRIIQAQKDLYAQLNIVKRAFEPKRPDLERTARIEQEIGPTLKEAIQVRGKLAAERAVKAVLNGLLEKIPAENVAERVEAKQIFYALEEKAARRLILDEGKRADGRSFTDIRPISIEVGQLPRTHGSALFTRGETQALATVTLGTFEDVQRIDGLGENSEKRFMLHYNFPPFSVGEVGFLRGPGRREIGHGALAEKAILPSMPAEEDFPYTVRLVSDILESNGSSSMATVCGGVLALMDAGVPLKMVVAGISTGLILEGDRHAVLTDIAGYEDHYGDMDFKIAGTEKGITAIQLDIKVPCLSFDILREAMYQSRDARLQILAKMKSAIPAPRPEISPFAPRILILSINPEKVGEVIGPSGKVIKRIIALTGAKIDVEEGGRICIASVDVTAAERARDMIREITAEAELGKVYTGKIVRLEEYGAFVEIMPSIVGLLHVSEVAPYHIKNIRDVMKLGQEIEVKVVTVDGDRIRLSRKALDPDAQAPPPQAGGAPQGQDQDRGRRPYRGGGRPGGGGGGRRPRF